MTKKTYLAVIAALLGSAAPASACGPTGEILLLLAVIAAAALLVPIFGVIAAVRIRRKGFSWGRALVAGTAALGETWTVLAAGAGSMAGLFCLALLAIKAVAVCGPLGTESTLQGITTQLADERLFPTL